MDSSCSDEGDSQRSTYPSERGEHASVLGMAEKLSGLYNEQREYAKGSAQLALERRAMEDSPRCGGRCLSQQVPGRVTGREERHSFKDSEDSDCSSLHHRHRSKSRISKESNVSTACSTCSSNTCSSKASPTTTSRSPLRRFCTSPAWSPAHRLAVAQSLACRPGQLPRCFDCGTRFVDLSAFCRFCGSRRLMCKDIDDIFHVLVGNRSTFRKTDLGAFTHRIWSLCQKADAAGVTARSFRRSAEDMEQLFDQTLALQVSKGHPCSQGLTLEYFQDFLAKVAHALHMTGSGLLNAFFAEVGCQRATAEEEHLGCGPEVQAAPVPSLEGGVSMSACRSATSPKSKLRKAVTRIMGTSSPDHSRGQARFAAIMGDCSDVLTVVPLAAKHRLPLAEVRRRRMLFRAFDTDGNEQLSAPEFLRAIRHRCNLAEDEPIPQHMVHQSWLKANKDGNAGIDFEEYLLWSIFTGETLDLADLGTTESMRRSSSSKHLDRPPDRSLLAGLRLACQRTRKFHEDGGPRSEDTDKSPSARPPLARRGTTKLYLEEGAAPTVASADAPVLSPGRRKILN